MRLGKRDADRIPGTMALAPLWMGFVSLVSWQKASTWGWVKTWVVARVVVVVDEEAELEDSTRRRRRLHGFDATRHREENALANRRDIGCVSRDEHFLPDTTLARKKLAQLVGDVRLHKVVGHAVQARLRRSDDAVGPCVGYDPHDHLRAVNLGVHDLVPGEEHGVGARVLSEHVEIYQPQPG